MMERWSQFILILVITQGYSCAFLKESPTPSPAFTCPSELPDGYYTLNNQCTNDYYMCYDGNMISHQRCPGSSVFDPASQTCVELALCFECPAEEGKYPIPLQCVGDYYECIAGYPQKLTCANNNIFDPVTYECVPSSEATCMISFNCSSDGFYTYPDTCSGLYFYCAGGQSFTMYCPSGSVFDQNLSTCKPIEETCIPGKITTTSTTTPTPTTTPNTTPTTTPTTTPSTTPTTTPSTTPTNTPTTTSTTTPTTTPTTSSAATPTTTPTTIPITTLFPGFICPSPNGNDGLYAAPGQCVEIYYECVNGIAYPESCSEGYVFDPVTFTCTPSALASCNQKLDCSSDGLYPYPDACSNLYFVCTAGDSYVEYCPDNLVFDPVSLKCVAKEDASCINN